MTDRDKLDLKGPVHQISLERIGARLRRFEWVFNRGGRLLESKQVNDAGKETVTRFLYDELGQRLTPNPQIIVQRPDGTWTESETLAGVQNSAWSGLPQLHGVAFSAPGAVRVTTVFDGGDTPTEIIFVDASEDVVTRMILRSDDRGNIVEAIRDVGKNHNVSGSGSFPCSQLEVRFKYDSMNRLLGIERFAGGQSRGECVYSYNVQGDRITAQENNGPLVHIEYEYDRFDNWVRQVVHQATGRSDESRRVINYHS
jgi:hypothetical protein